MGKGCLTEEQMQELVRILDKTMQEHFERQAARFGRYMELVGPVVNLNYSFNGSDR